MDFLHFSLPILVAKTKLALLLKMMKSSCFGKIDQTDKNEPIR